MVDANLCLRRHGRLGVKRDTCPGQADHVEIIGAVANRDGVGGRQAEAR